MASWVVRTPAIRDQLSATTAEMGVVLLGLSVGSITGVVAGGPATAWRGARATMLSALLAVAASLAIIGVASVTGSLWTAAAGLSLFGLGMGSAEVAINVEAADLEQVLGRPVLVLLHGCYSLGTLLGATAGLGLTAAGFAVAAHMGVLALISFGVVAVAIRYVPAGTGVRGRRTATSGGEVELHHPDRTARRRPAALSLADPYLIAVSVIALSVALAEGAATDWLPLLMVDDFGFGATAGSGIFLLFALCMTVGRFSSSAALRRWSKASVLLGSTLVSIAGLLCITLVDNPWLAIAAIVLWGLGASLSFPVALSAAADGADNPTARVTIVSMAGYLSILAGPPMLGFVGEHIGLRGAMFVPLGFLVVAALVARSLRSPGTGAAVPAVASVLSPEAKPGSVDQTIPGDRRPPATVQDGTK
jgi:fucose permease